MSVVAPPVESKHHKSGQRLNIITEIIETEKTYIEELEVCHAIISSSSSLYFTTIRFWKSSMPNH